MILSSVLGLPTESTYALSMYRKKVIRIWYINSENNHICIGLPFTNNHQIKAPHNYYIHKVI